MNGSGACQNSVAALIEAVQEKEKELKQLLLQVAAATTALETAATVTTTATSTITSTVIPATSRPASENTSSTLAPTSASASSCSTTAEENTTSSVVRRSELSRLEVARYSRQLILPELAVSGQLLLSSTRVLVVGCGGLGCPAAIYLAAAGVGVLGLLDYDRVEISNLHRQVLHTEGKIGMEKVESVARSVKDLNSNVKVEEHRVVLDSKTALQIIRCYDIVLDCTDNVATRYLLNDACVLSNIPLVSGAALRWEGQLTVYNYKEGPCYRCIFPKPPPPETVTNCSDGGVMGVVPGIVGSMQALEAIKIVCNIGTSLSSSMMLFDALTSSFRTIKLRSRQSKCEVCGDRPTIKELIDYEQFCGAKAEDKDAALNLLSSEQRVSVRAYKDMLDTKKPHVLIDVRLAVELQICSLAHCLNIPFANLTKKEEIEKIREVLLLTKTTDVVCVCRRGNDSQKAVLALGEILEDCTVKDIVGGLTEWANKIDQSMPVY